MQKPKVPLPSFSKKQYMADMHGIRSWKMYRSLPSANRYGLERDWVQFLRKNDHFWVMEYEQYITDLRTYYVTEKIPVSLGVKKHNGRVLGNMHDERSVFLVPSDMVANLPNDLKLTWVEVSQPLVVEDEFEFRHGFDRFRDEVLYLDAYKEE